MKVVFQEQLVIRYSNIVLAQSYLDLMFGTHIINSIKYIIFEYDNDRVSSAYVNTLWRNNGY